MILSLIVSQWVSDVYMAEDSIPDRIGPNWIFPSILVVIRLTLVTIEIVARLLLTMVWRKTIDKLVNIVGNDHSRIIIKQYNL